MATSQYSLLRQYTPYTSPYNIDLIKDVMVYKQGKVDANREKMYDQIDYLMGQEIAKPQDRAYFESRMHDAISRINRNYKGADLSTDGVVRNIQGEISTVLDDKVLNAIAGTKEYKNLQKQIDYIRTNKPEAYSPINELDAEMPYLNWLSDGQTGSRLGSLRYVPYVDYKGNMTKRLQEFRKNNKGRKIQQPIYDSDGNPTGMMHEMEVDKMSGQQILNHLISSTSANELEQMAIEARYMAHTSPIFKDKDSVNSYLDSYVDRYDNEIAALNLQKGEAGDNPDMILELDSRIQEIRNRRTEMISEINSIKNSNDVFSAANFIVKNNYYNEMMDTWSYDNTSYLRKKDDGVLAVWKEQRDREKHNSDMSKNILEMELLKKNISKAKSEDERLKLENEFFKRYGYYPTKKGGSGGNSGGGSNNVNSNGIYTTVTEVGFNTENEDLSKFVFDLMDKSEKSKKENMLSLWNTFTDAEKKGLEELIKQSGINYGDNISIEEKVYEYFDANGGIQNSYIASRKDRMDKINAIHAANDRINWVKTPMEEIDKMWDGIINSDRLTGIAANYLKEKGILDSLAENYFGNVNYDTVSKISNAFKYASIALEFKHKNKSNGDFVEYVSYVDNELSRKAVSELKKIFGDYDDINISDYIKNGKLISYNDSPNTIKFLSKLFDSGVETRVDFRNARESAYDKSTMNDIISKSAFNDSILTYSFSEDDEDKNVKENFKRLKGLYIQKAEIQGVDGGSFKKEENHSMSIKRVPDGSGGFINYLIKDTDMDNAVIVSNEDLSRNDFNIDFKSRNHSINDSETKRYSCRFFGGKDNENNFRNTIYNGLHSKATTVDSIYEYIESTVPSVSALDSDKKSILKSHIERMVSASEKLAVSAKGREGVSVDQTPWRSLYVNFYDVDDRDKNATPVFVNTVNDVGEFIDDEVRTVRDVPQFYFRNYLMDAYVKRLTSLGENIFTKDGQLNGINGDDLSKIENFVIKKSR